MRPALAEIQLPDIDSMRVQRQHLQALRYLYGLPGASTDVAPVAPPASVVGWPQTEAAALVALADIDPVTAGIYYNGFVNHAGLVSDGTGWNPAADSPRGGGLEATGSSNLYVGETTNPATNVSFSKLGGAANSWGLSCVARVIGVPLGSNCYFLVMLGLVTGVGLAVGFNQNVDATHFGAGTPVGTTYLSTVLIDDAFHRWRMWYRASTGKYWFAIDAEVPVEIVSIAPLNVGDRCPVDFMMNNTGTARKYCVNRFLMVTSSEHA